MLNTAASSKRCWIGVGPNAWRLICFISFGVRMSLMGNRAWSSRFFIRFASLPYAVALAGTSSAFFTWASKVSATISNARRAALRVGVDGLSSDAPKSSFAEFTKYSGDVMTRSGKAIDSASMRCCAACRAFWAARLDASAAAATLRDEKQSAVVLVTLPEELPARETSTLVSDIRELRMPFGPLVVNAMPPAAATDPALDKVLAANANTPPPPELAGILAGVNVLAARRRDAERIVTGLASDPGLPMLQLPRLPSNDLGPEEIAHLADLLATALSIQT